MPTDPARPAAWPLRYVLTTVFAVLIAWTLLALTTVAKQRILVQAQHDAAELALPTKVWFAATDIVTSLTGLVLLTMAWVCLLILGIARATRTRSQPSMLADERMSRIARVAIRLRILQAVFIVPLLVIASFVVFTGRDDVHALQMFAGEIAPWLERGTALGIVALAFVIVWNVDRLLGLYARGILFSEANAACLRWIGYVLAFLGSGLFPVLLRLLGVEVHVMLRVELMLAGGLLILIAWVTQEAEAMREERELTV